MPQASWRPIAREGLPRCKAQGDYPTVTHRWSTGPPGARGPAPEASSRAHPREDEVRLFSWKAVGCSACIWGGVLLVLCERDEPDPRDRPAAATGSTLAVPPPSRPALLQTTPTPAVAKLNRLTRSPSAFLLLALKLELINSRPNSAVAGAVGVQDPQQRRTPQPPSCSSRLDARPVGPAALAQHPKLARSDGASLASRSP